jgi:pilus assembly protein Flp/PilA
MLLVGVAMFSRVSRLLRSDLGTTAIEYALIASLIVVVIVASVTATGVSVKNLYNAVVTSF